MLALPSSLLLFVLCLSFLPFPSPSSFLSSPSFSLSLLYSVPAFPPFPAAPAPHLAFSPLPGEWRRQASKAETPSGGRGASVLHQRCAKGRASSLMAMASREPSVVKVLSA